MSRIPSNIDQFNQGLALANQGIATASANQRAKLEARLRAAEIRQRGKIAALQADLEAERLQTLREIQESRQEGFEKREQSIDARQQAALEFQEKENAKQRRMEAILLDRQQRFESEMVKSRQKVAQLKQQRLYDAAKEEKGRLRELDNMGRAVGEDITVLAALNDALQGRSTNRFGQIDDALEKHTVQLQQFSDQLNQEVSREVLLALEGIGGAARPRQMPMVTGTGVGLFQGDLFQRGLGRGDPFGAYVKDARGESRRAAAHQVVEAVVEGTSFSGVFPRGNGAAFKGALRLFLLAVADYDLLQQEGQATESLKAGVAARLQELRRETKNDQMLGMALAAIERSMDAATTDKNMAASFQEAALKLGELQHSARRDRVKEITAWGRDLQENVTELNGATVALPSGAEGRLGEDVPNLSGEHFRPPDLSQVVARVLSALRREVQEGRLDEATVRRLVGQVDDPDGKLAAKVSAIMGQLPDPELIEQVQEELGIQGIGRERADLEALLDVDRGARIAELRRQEEGIRQDVLDVERGQLDVMSDLAEIEAGAEVPELPTLEEFLEQVP